MTTQDMAKENRILEFEIGSHLYGTSTPTSDHDYAGIFIAPKEYYIGLNSIEEVDCSVVSKLESGRNAPDAVDLKYYELKKFIRLAKDCNPNIVEFLFVPSDKMLFKNYYGSKLIACRELFLHKGLTQKFIGYAKGQLHKMNLKPDNYEKLNSFKRFCDSAICQDEYSLSISEFKNTLFESRNIIDFSKLNEHFVIIGDLKFNPKVKMKDVYTSVCNRINKATSRTELYTKYGYDTKFGMHCCRLLLEGIELLDTGRLVFPLKERNMLLDIRNDKWAVSDVLSYAEQLTNDINVHMENSSLPDKPNFDKIQQLLMELVEESWSER